MRQPFCKLDLGKKPDRLERLDDGKVRVTFGGESFEVPLKLLRLYQDIQVRVAAQKMIEEPLKREGIDRFEIRESGRTIVAVSKDEAKYFEVPDLPDETIIEDTRRSAFSIISLAFKEDNKWRLFDGNAQISAMIEDEAFLARVDANQVAFAKGDILVCDVRIKQKRTAEGLKTEYAVERIVEHRPGAHQISFVFDEEDLKKE